jgi:hypothetical protein
MCNFFNILSVGVSQHVTVYCQLSGVMAGSGCTDNWQTRIIKNIQCIEQRAKYKIVSYLLYTQYIHSFSLLFAHTVSDLCLY